MTRGSGNTKCLKCGIKLKWNENKYRIVREEYFSDAKSKCRIENCGMWHTRCWEELNKIRTNERREEN